MPENKSKTLPEFESVEKLVDFFDANDMGDDMDSMPEVRFDVDLKKKRQQQAG